MVLKNLHPSSKLSLTLLVRVSARPHQGLGEESDEVLPHAREREDEEDPALHEYGRQRLLVRHAPGAVVAHHGVGEVGVQACLRGYESGALICLFSAITEKAYCALCVSNPKHPYLVQTAEASCLNTLIWPDWHSGKGWRPVRSGKQGRT